MAEARATGRAAVPARAALAGNPSDGYGGAVLAVTVAGLAAHVEATHAAADRVEPAGCAALVGAALRRFRAHVGPAADAPTCLRVRSNIPREVGLAGSSAIVLATLRALAALTGAGIPAAQLAATALDVEVVDLGIAAGPQDRVVQARGGLVAMDFAGGGVGVARSIDPSGLPPLRLGWLPAAGEASGRYHGDLRARHARGEPAVHEAMAALRAHGLAAASAAADGDHAALAAALDGSYDARARVGPQDPRHAALIHAARHAGLAANSAGSGGAIVATGGPLTALHDALAPLGGRAIDLHVAPRSG